MSKVSFDFSVLRVVVSKICQDVGWHTTHVSALDALSEILAYYIRHVSIIAVDYANLYGRAQPSLDDLGMAFEHLSIDMLQLKDFVLNVEAAPLPFSLPFYPLACRQSRHFDNCDSDSERPEYYDDWLPSLNFKKIFNTELSDNNILKDIEKLNGKCDEIPAICDKPADNIEPVHEEVVDGKEKPDKAVEENVENKEIQDDKKKLVLRFSLSKSFEDQAETTQTNEADASQTNQTTTATSRLMASRAFNKFIQSTLYKNPESLELKNGLRAPDTQRLINNHESRENSPEPDPLSTSNILNGDINANDSMKLPELHENKKRSKKFLLKSRKKNRNRDFENSTFGLFSDEFKPNIKVKELGIKKKQKKVGENGEKRKKIKKLKDGIKPLSIKVTGFGFTENDDKSIEDFEFGDSNENTSKKRQYKKKDRPKDYVERRGRKPKGQSVKTTLQLGSEFDNLEDGELPPSPSFDSFSSLHSRSITPTKLKKSKNNEIFGDTEAAKMLVLMSESSENLKEDDPKRKPEPPSSDNDDSIADLNDSKSSKKSARPVTNKRPKGAYSKKTVKSAETVESSDDSSSDNEPSVHSIAVSLPPPPSEASLKSVEITTASSIQPSRKRRHSGSSVSSVSSVHSSISASSISKRASSVEHSLIGIDILKQEKHKSKSSKPESTEVNKVKESKHKKNKKHSKEKHRHEDKAHKKHKKPKLDKEVKDKHKEKDKDKEKSFKPKLSIKLGPNLDIKRPDDFVPINEAVVVPPLLETSSVPLFSESNDIDLPKYIVEKSEDSVKSKKKRGPKKKILSEPQSELVFIKDISSKPSSKELKIKTPIINVQSKLFDDVSSFDKITKSSAKPKVKEPKVDKDFELFKKEIKLPEEKIKVKKEKELPGLSIVLKTTDDKPKKDKAKDDSRKEHSTKKTTKQEENKSCIVIRETITVENADDDKVWICPHCKCIDDGTPMIGCDTCDDWYHYNCVGIRQEPKEDESWFCPKCIERQKQEQKKIEKMLKKKEKKVKMEKIQNSVTITPIPNTSALDPNLPAFGSGVSFLPFPSSTSSRQPSLTITPTSAYKPTGRPRGRPRKDSSLSRQPNVTITPIGPSSSYDHYNDPSLMYFQQAPSTSSQAFSFTPQPKDKKSKSICLQCNISDDKSPMMLCDQCRHWYHWACVGITSAPSPDVKWHCLKCKKKKSSKQQHHISWDEGQDDSAEESEGTSLTDAKFRALTGGLGSSGSNRRFQSPVHRTTTENVEVPDLFQNQQWRCGTCQEVSTSDASINWIACDECDQWYHFVCEGVTKAPDDSESWFCKKCIQRQKNIAS